MGNWFTEAGLENHLEAAAEKFQIAWIYEAMKTVYKSLIPMLKQSGSVKILALALTRVNAQSQANDYMTQCIESAKEVGKYKRTNDIIIFTLTLIYFDYFSGCLENAIGWYHSHPG